MSVSLRAGNRVTKAMAPNRLLGVVSLSHRNLYIVPEAENINIFQWFYAPYFKT
jgi:hypothetical protein